VQTIVANPKSHPKAKNSFIISSRLTDNGRLGLQAILILHGFDIAPAGAGYQRKNSAGLRPAKRHSSGRERKRQRTGALHDASRVSHIAGKRFASWSAAALRRFSSDTRLFQITSSACCSFSCAKLFVGFKTPRC
jgi:hypothetical protein